jgi:hypothetical protein
MAQDARTIRKYQSQHIKNVSSSKEMKILVTGKGGSAGSWLIRGKQLGAAIGAIVQPMANFMDCRDADIIIVVKRTPLQIIDAVRRSGRPWVFDIVDGWPQPCSWDEHQAKGWLKYTIGELKPNGIVYGTERMQLDSGIPGLILPHHSWDRYAIQEPIIREQIRTLGYEGMPGYLGKWLPELEKICSARDIDFLINGDMRQADVGIALRDGGGYPARWWKPGTKLSNLHALGIPALCTLEAGYQSVACGEEFWIETASDISDALDRLSHVTERREISLSMRSSMVKVEDVAHDYLAWLKAL